MDYRAALTALIVADRRRWNALECVRALRLPDCWIAAGFVRDAVWDHLHGCANASLAHDVDVIWFSTAGADETTDVALERELHSLCSGLKWSVKNQARMHRRNGDAPYKSATDAMRWWPETATAVAVSRSTDDQLEIKAPFGLRDLFELKVTPTPAFMTLKRPIFERRCAEKQWFSRYPLVTLTRV